MIICRTYCVHRVYAPKIDDTVCELRDVNINAKGKCADRMEAALCGDCEKWGTDECPYLLAAPSTYDVACSAVEAKEKK